MPTILDIHTHRHNAKGAIRSIRFGIEEMPHSGPCSLGIHPWDADLVHVSLPDKGHWPTNAVAVGECGLDRACDAPFERQEEVFIAQVMRAEELQLPVIIHCVRAFHEVVAIRKKRNCKQQWIVHGFNKGGDTLHNLLAAGLYVSFGAAVLDSSSPAAWASRQVPPGRFYVETDDSQVDVNEIVTAIASQRGTSVEHVLADLATFP